MRVGPNDFFSYFEIAKTYAIITLVCRTLVFYLFNVYGIFWRYISARDVLKIFQGVTLSSLIVIMLSFLLNEQFGHLPRSVYFIDALLCLFLLLAIRINRRIYYEFKNGDYHHGNIEKVLIYGAGFNGRTLANRFQADGKLGAKLVGFIDDDKKKQGLKISGVPVLAGHEELESYLKKFEINVFFIAISSLPREVLQKVVLTCAKNNVRPRVISDFYDKTESGRFNFARSVELKDLLKRPARGLDLDKIEALVKNKKVLVTGAGGTIGAELSRQIFANSPSRLLLLDHSEFNLFTIDKELRTSTDSTSRVVPLLIDLKDSNAVDVVLKKYRPDVVIHAAAYKHVHLVELNPGPSILNNVKGTLNILLASKNIGVQNFVLISTDKAVNPVGVMGSTKRACELLVTAMAIESKKHYCSVRFGNVLGSSGSLIPTLQSQIDKGGPVTITHQDMTRFFMLIPEAVSLVLTAASNSHPGDVNILKMGDAIKIVDIARSLIALNGKTEEEVPIVFTGIRPGEKMYEELYIRGDELKTDHPDILTLPMGDSAIFNMPEGLSTYFSLVDKMIKFAEENDERAVHVLMEIVKSQFEMDSQIKSDDYKV